MRENLPDDQIRKLVEIMKRLRGPRGCPWDQLQTSATLKPYLLEEAHEVLHALENEDADNIKGELGDLLLQIVFHAAIFEEQGLFDIDDIAQSISDKLIRRHPHVFGDSNEQDLGQLDRQWESIKKQERKIQPDSLLGSVQRDLPALLQAQKVSSKVARVGFDWDDLNGVLEKFEEEMQELKAAIAGGDKNETRAEFGDLLFTLVNIGRHLDIDSETALLQMLERFRKRFHLMEEMISNSGENIEAMDINQLESLWQKAKAKTGANK